MLKGIEHKLLNKGIDFNFEGIEYDSRLIKNNYIFVAMQGSNIDGNEFIASAIKNGAKLILTDRENINYSDYKDITFYYVPNLRKELGKIASNLYNNPQDKLCIIGITGTNGKTTSSYILEGILDKSARIGTTNYRIGDEFFEAKNTTPESLDLIKLMNLAVKKGIKYFIMEVSSHALSMGRVEMIKFSSVIFTNFTQDHLDYHKTMQDYLNAKLHIFDLLKDDAKVCINADDPTLSKLNKDNTSDFGINNGKIKGSILEYTNSGMKIKIDSYTLNTKLIGKHNLYNILGVYTSLVNLGMDKYDIIKKIENIPSVNGRFELIDNNLNAKIVVDYAHTPDGLDNVLNTLKEITESKLITVFGAGGDRDRTKRDKMAIISAKYSDEVIITSDNPRTEDPYNILEDIEQGFKEINFKNYTKMVDRSEAIKLAISKLKKGDSLIIAGKGHEDYQIIGKEKIHFSDKEEIIKALKK